MEDLKTLKELWKEFEDVPVDENDNIEEPFYHFPVGVSKFVIWHWFDESCPNSLYEDLMLPFPSIDEDTIKVIEVLEAVMRSYEAYCPERYYSDDNVALAEDIIKEILGE